MLINGQRSRDITMSTVELKLGRAITNIHVDVLAAPLASWHSLLHSRVHQSDATQHHQKNDCETVNRLGCTHHTHLGAHCNQARTGYPIDAAAAKLCHNASRTRRHLRVRTCSAKLRSDLSSISA